MRVGDRVADRYEVTDRLGAGGTGAVWRATDTVLGREVALKVLRSVAQGDEAHHARMREEARLAAGLQHPAIAQVFDYGEEGDTPFIVMALVEGQTLGDLLRERGSLPPGQVMDVVAQVASGLAVAHESGIVHRDLKPGNVMVTPEGRCVLLDFGIARAQDAEPLTLTGTIVGTVDYLSPEQAQGGSATVRSDLYSLGMVAYECLAGTRPFRRDNPVATALAHVQEEAPPLPDAIDPAVRGLVEEMIAKVPEGRPGSAEEVAGRAAALAAAVGRGATSTVPSDPPTREVRVAGEPAPSRRPAAWLLLPVAVLLLLTALGAIRASGDDHVEPAPPAASPAGQPTRQPAPARPSPTQASTPVSSTPVTTAPSATPVAQPVSRPRTTRSPGKASGAGRPAAPPGKAKGRRH